jgi:hypothetical protein
VGVEQVLRVVLLAVLIALAGSGMYAIFVLVGALRSARGLTDDLRGRLTPLVEDATVTVQAMNLELMRLDDILDNVQRMSDTVEDAARSAEEAVHVPMQKVAEYAERARRFIAAMREK